MVVERISYRVKHVHKREFIELVKALVAAAGATPRVCSPIYGDTGLVTSDLEFETEEDQHRFWNNFDFSLPEYVEFMDRFGDMTETGYIHELWRVHQHSAVFGRTLRYTKWSKLQDSKIVSHMNVPVYKVLPLIVRQVTRRILAGQKENPKRFRISIRDGKVD